MPKKQKKIPTAEEIDAFMTLFNKQAWVHGLTQYQIDAFSQYGVFLAAAGNDHHQTIVAQIMKALLKYNLATDQYFMKLVDKKKLSRDLNKAIAFRKTLIDPFDRSKLINPRAKRYNALVQLIDMYIQDLKEAVPATAQIIPSNKLGENVRPSKTPLKECIKDIIEEFKLVGNSENAKKLVDSLDNPSS